MMCVVAVGKPATWEHLKRVKKKKILLVVFVSFSGVSTSWPIVSYQCDISKLGVGKRYTKFTLENQFALAPTHHWLHVTP